MSHDTSGFGTVLRQLRTAAALSQEALAERAGLSPRGISDLERGVRRSPHLATVGLLADALTLVPTDRQRLLAAARPGRLPEMQDAAPGTYPPLPMPLTSLIGREQELTELKALLRELATRLLTLTGPGGTGKTRLAIAVAEQMTADFSDGVVFVPLAPLGDPAFVVSAIAQRLGVREAAGQSLLDRLKAHLADKQTLLVLDNFEHLLPAASLITDLLAACPSLKTLVTSRAVLHLSAEQTYPVPPLALPDPVHLPSLDALGQTEAVRLFVGRVQSAKPDFVLSEANAPAVAGIVHRLDGLPLAVELAAARVRVLSPAALLARLDRRLPLLTGGAQDLPNRQRTLRDTIAWSYDLLPPQEQALFRRLAVFAGGWTLEAAEVVCDPSVDMGIDVLEGMTSLVDHSLVQQQGTDDDARFGMLETVREFGLEQLEASGETHDTRCRQGAYYATLATLGRGLTPGMAMAARHWLDLLEVEEDNLWSVLSWSLEQGEIELGLQVAGAMHLYWYLRKRRLTEARAWLDRALPRGRLTGAADEAMDLALTCASGLAHLQDDLVRSEMLAEEALAINQRIGGPKDIAEAKYVLAIPVNMQGDYDRAEQLYQEALEHFRAERDCYWMAEALLGVAHVALNRGDYERAAAAYEESLQLSQDIGSRPGAARAQSGLGFLARARGDPALACQLFQKSLAVWGEIDDATSTAICLEAMAGTICSLGMPQRAAQLLGAAEALRERISYPVPRGALPTYQQTIAGIQSSLSMLQFSTSWVEGRALSPAGAIALAGENLPSQDATDAETGMVVATAADVEWTPAAPQPSDVTGHGLTPRELEVLRLVATGRSNREIAEALSISVPTVKRHLSTILGKLALPSRSSATAYAHTHHLV
jgi:predicted ATPase/DNA-binding CsgD family transcriptional regulator/DNA-binding XRE family transcriptional regulator